MDNNDYYALLKSMCTPLQVVVIDHTAEYGWKIIEAGELQ